MRRMKRVSGSSDHSHGPAPLSSGATKSTLRSFSRTPAYWDAPDVPFSRIPHASHGVDPLSVLRPDRKMAVDARLERREECAGVRAVALGHEGRTAGVVQMKGEARSIGRPRRVHRVVGKKRPETAAKQRRQPHAVTALKAR